MTFWIIAAAMLVVALAFVLPPLWRARGDATRRAREVALLQAHRAGVLSDHELRAKRAALGAGAPPPAPTARAWALLLGVGLPLAALGLYRHAGEPRALDPVWRDASAVAAGTVAATTPDGAPPPDMQQAVSGLAERLRNQPDDLEGWMLLGRAYKSMERFGPALDALANAIRLAPENPDVMVEYAEAQVLASDARRFTGDARALLDRALVLQPEHQRGLWLLGIAHYQDGGYTDAAATWERLLAALPPDAEPRASLQQRIDEARMRAGLPAAPAPPANGAADGVAPSDRTTAAVTAPTDVPADTPAESASGEDAAAAAAPKLTITVDIAPELRAKIGASDVLFVFARAAEGPRMPLAIQRLPAASLPVTVVLDDSTSMMPALKLSTVPRVVIGARISKSGQAVAQAGDLETLSSPIDNTHADPLRLVIDTVVE